MSVSEFSPEDEYGSLRLICNFYEVFGGNYAERSVSNEYVRFNGECSADLHVQE
jgi:hypothetical protein